MGTNCDLQLRGFCNSDWASCSTSKRSTTGYFMMLGNSHISWRTKKQGTISRSSAKAEYRAMAPATSEIVWLCALLTSLGVKQIYETQLFCDNTTVIHIATNAVFHERTKHIEIDCYFVREKVQKRTVKNQLYFLSPPTYGCLHERTWG